MAACQLSGVCPLSPLPDLYRQSQCAQWTLDVDWHDWHGGVGVIGVGALEWLAWGCWSDWRGGIGAISMGALPEGGPGTGLGCWNVQLCYGSLRRHNWTERYKQCVMWFDTDPRQKSMQDCTASTCLWYVAGGWDYVGQRGWRQQGSLQDARHQSGCVSVSSLNQRCLVWRFLFWSVLV